MAYHPRMGRRANEFLTIAVLASTAMPRQQASAPGPWREQTAPLGKFERAAAGQSTSITLSPDGRHVAWVRRDAGRVSLVVDGISGSPFDEVGTPAFGADETVAYVARQGSSSVLMRSGHEVARFSDGSRVSDLQFSGTNLLYVLRSTRGAQVVSGDVIGPPHADVLEGSVRTFPGSTDAAYVAVAPGGQFLVAGGRAFAKYDDVSPPLLGRKGRTVSLATRKGRKLIVDERGESSSHDAVFGLALDPASGRVAYATTDAGVWRVIGPGARSRPMDRVIDLCLAPGGAHVAVAYEQDGAMFVLRETWTEGPYETVVEGTMRFTSDGRHLAYEAEQHDEFFVVMDRREQPHRYSDVVNGSIGLSPRGDHLVYLAEQDSRQFVVLDGREGARHQAARSLVLSPAGQHVAYVAEDSGHVRVIIDDRPGSVWDSILGDQIQFDSDSTLHFLARRGDRLVRVTHTLSPSQ
jgi:hypothetical protein